MKAMLDSFRERGIQERLCQVFSKIDRARFVQSKHPYTDEPQPIGSGQTISQPYIIAYMLQELDVQSSDTVLEVGSGSGYVIALLSLLAKSVVGTEIVHNLYAKSQQTLSNLERKETIPSNFMLMHTERLGAPEKGPFDKILVSAAAAELPQELVDQLADGGVMIVPIGTDDQWLVRVEKHGDTITHEDLLPVRFVPLL